MACTPDERRGSSGVQVGETSEEWGVSGSGGVVYPQSTGFGGGGGSGEVWKRSRPGRRTVRKGRRGRAVVSLQSSGRVEGE